MRVLACQRDDCPIERMREALNASREAAVANGYRVTRYSKNDYVQTCGTCRMTRGWVRYEDGAEREIPQEVIWGSGKPNAA